MTISWTNPHTNNYVQLSRAISEMTPPGKIPAVDAQERGGREKGRLRPSARGKSGTDVRYGETDGRIMNRKSEAVISPPPNFALFPSLLSSFRRVHTGSRTQERGMGKQSKGR